MKTPTYQMFPNSRNPIAALGFSDCTTLESLFWLLSEN